MAAAGGGFWSRRGLFGVNHVLHQRCPSPGGARTLPESALEDAITRKGVRTESLETQVPPSPPSPWDFRWRKPPILLLDVGMAFCSRRTRALEMEGKAGGQPDIGANFGQDAFPSANHLRASSLSGNSHPPPVSSLPLPSVLPWYLPMLEPGA